MGYLIFRVSGVVRGRIALISQRHAGRATVLIRVNVSECSRDLHTLVKLIPIFF